MAETTKLKLTKHTPKEPVRETVWIVIDDDLRTVIDIYKSSNVLLTDADVVKILIGKQVTEELRSKQKQAGYEQSRQVMNY